MSGVVASMVLVCVYGHVLMSIAPPLPSPAYLHHFWFIFSQFWLKKQQVGEVHCTIHGNMGFECDRNGIRGCATIVGHIASQCNTLQHTAMHCNALQQHCNPLQRTATHCNALQRTATQGYTLKHTATHTSTRANV